VRRGGEKEGKEGRKKGGGRERETRGVGGIGEGGGKEKREGGGEEKRGGGSGEGSGEGVRGVRGAGRGKAGGGKRRGEGAGGGGRREGGKGGRGSSLGWGGGGKEEGEGGKIEEGVVEVRGKGSVPSSLVSRLCFVVGWRWGRVGFSRGPLRRVRHHQRDRGPGTLGASALKPAPARRSLFHTRTLWDRPVHAYAYPAQWRNAFSALGQRPPPSC